MNIIFAVKDLFTLVDIGVAVVGDLKEGRIEPNMVLQLGVESLSVFRVDAKPNQTKDIGIVISNVTKDYLKSLGIQRGYTIQFTGNLPS
jgi:hypothetical protein